MDLYLPPTFHRPCACVPVASGTLVVCDVQHVDGAPHVAVVLLHAAPRRHASVLRVTHQHRLAHPAARCERLRLTVFFRCEDRQQGTCAGIHRCEQGKDSPFVKAAHAAGENFIFSQRCRERVVQICSWPQASACSKLVAQARSQST